VSQRVSVIAKKWLEKYDEISITFYSAGVTDEIFNEAWPGTKAHPLDKASSVLNALDRESKRQNSLFAKAHCNVWGRMIRVFTLKTDNPTK